MHTPHAIVIRIAALPLVLLSACITERYIDKKLSEYGITEAPGTTGTSSTGDSSSSSSGSSSSSETSSSSSGSGTAAHDDSSGDLPTTSNSDTTQASASSTDATSTGGPVCGNGVEEEGESCDDADDADPADGCHACVRESLMFVSSKAFQAKDLEGLFGADQWCRHLAAVAGLRRFATFKAWLSSTQESAADRLLHSAGRYVLVNGLVVADDWTELTSGALEHPIDATETSESYQGTVWTGTLPDGTTAPGTTQCDDWTVNGLTLGARGNNSYKDSYWTFVADDGCNGEMRIYCIEQ